MPGCPAHGHPHADGLTTEAQVLLSLAWAEVLLPIAHSQLLVVLSGHPVARGGAAQAVSLRGGAADGQTIC